MRKNSTNLWWSHTEKTLHEIIGFANHLHVTILYAIMNHFDIVAGTIWADVCGAGNAAFDRFARLCAF